MLLTEINLCDSKKAAYVVKNKTNDEFAGRLGPIRCVRGVV